MKKSFFLALLVISSGTIFAQRESRDRNNGREGTPPPQVQQSFKRDHPKAGDARWYQANNQWHAQYPDKARNNKNAEAYYDPRGRHVDTHVEWNRNELPKNVDSKIYRRYHTRNYKVYKIERPNNLSLFQIIFNIGGGNRTVYVDENGNEVNYTDRH